MVNIVFQCTSSPPFVSLSPGQVCVLITRNVVAGPGPSIGQGFLWFSPRPRSQIPHRCNCTWRGGEAFLQLSLSSPPRVPCCPSSEQSQVVVPLSLRLAIRVQWSVFLIFMHYRLNAIREVEGVHCQKISEGPALRRLNCLSWLWLRPSFRLPPRADRKHRSFARQLGFLPVRKISSPENSNYFIIFESGS